MKKIGIPFFVLCFSLCFCLTASAAGLLSPAISVLQEDVTLVKTGIGKNTVTFSAADFENALGKESFTAIEMASLPPVEAGVLKLGALDVTPGQIIAKEAIPSLRFLPSGSGEPAVFTFLPYGSSYENAFVFTVYSLDTLNFAPTAAAATLDAKESVPVYSVLTAADPDGDALTFTIVKPPKKGTLKLTDRSLGSFCYTADRNGAGTDSFTFTATDPYGNTSAPATVSIATSENENGLLYVDLAGSRDHLCAVELAERSVIVGEKLGGNSYFHPDLPVSRAEFLTMMLAVMEPDVHPTAGDASSFADRAAFAPYQDSAIRIGEALGIVVGMDTERGRCFMPNDAITAGQAATIVSRVAALRELSLGDAVAVGVGMQEEISDEGYAVLASLGLAAGKDRHDKLTRLDAAKLLYSFIHCK